MEKEIISVQTQTKEGTKNQILEPRLGYPKMVIVRATYREMLRKRLRRTEMTDRFSEIQMWKTITREARKRHSETAAEKQTQRGISREAKNIFEPLVLSSMSNTYFKPQSPDHTFHIGPQPETVI